MVGVGNGVSRSIVAILCLVVGCAGPPQRVTWREDVQVLRPAPKEVSKETNGYLEVETGTLPPGPDEDAPRYLPFYVYTEEGKWIVDGRRGRTSLKPGKLYPRSRARIDRCRSSSSQDTSLTF